MASAVFVNGRIFTGFFYIVVQELARLTFQAGHNTSQPIQIDRMNEFLREDKRNAEHFNFTWI